MFRLVLVILRETMAENNTVILKQGANHNTLQELKSSLNRRICNMCLYSTKPIMYNVKNTL